jgi:hypothetical protein
MYGNTHWVKEHGVERDDWTRYGSGESNEEDIGLLLEGAHIKNSRTARFVNPNAYCPVCGAPVFFYQNENGSRVFFDELGPPWPKHPCTDTKARSRRQHLEVLSDDLEPRARGDDEIEEIRNWITAASMDPEFLFEWRFGKKPWTVAKIAKRIRGAKGVFLILNVLESEPMNNRFMYCKALPKCVKEGSVVMIRKDVLSYFNIATMTPGEVQVRRISSASSFVKELVSG